MISPSEKPSFYDLANMQVLKNYGFTNTTGLSWTDRIETGYPTTRNQTSTLGQVIIFNDWYFSWTGLLGLDPRPTNYTDKGGMKGDPQSFMKNLKAAGTIPSISWGYHAGKVSAGK
jgi:hypothetical protein